MSTWITEPINEQHNGCYERSLSADILVSIVHRKKFFPRRKWLFGLFQLLRSNTSKTARKWNKLERNSVHYRRIPETVSRVCDNTRVGGEAKQQDKLSGSRLIKLREHLSAGFDSSFNLRSAILTSIVRRRIHLRHSRGLTRFVHFSLASILFSAALIIVESPFILHNN